MTTHPNVLRYREASCKQARLSRDSVYQMYHFSISLFYGEVGGTNAKGQNVSQEERIAEHERKERNGKTGDLNNLHIIGGIVSRSHATDVHGQTAPFTHFGYPQGMRNGGSTPAWLLPRT